jgi:hypothetical protein
VVATFRYREGGGICTWEELVWCGLSVRFDAEVFEDAVVSSFRLLGGVY